MSTYRNDSELTQFNRYLGADWFAVSAETVAVVAEAQRLAELSEGAFDVTVGPLVNLWGFGPDPRLATIPPADELAAARERVGYGMLEYRRDPPALRKARPDLYVDLSSIAKGFAVDQVATAIEKLGATDYLVEVGGELRTRGLSSRGEPWRVAIERPIPGQRSVERVIEPGDSALATSGDYRNYFELDGRRFSHTIDPATGQPIDHDLASVTVLHPSATVADGLATALLVQGAERGLLLCEKHAIAALMIVRAGDGFQERTSSAFDATTSAGLE
jgi:thiamine biosynthesis lipoprotein